jgi:predicted acylesterase/phospholipase RssA
MRRSCDLVLKGGVASGVAFPSAIQTISRAFDLRAIGGTSAGAIAAALAAAAQYRRLTDADDAEAGFARLDALPSRLAQDDRLFGLFTPNANTRRLFDALLAAGAPGTAAPRRIAALLAAYPVAALIGSSAGLIHAVLASTTAHAPWRALHRILAALEISVGALAGAAAALALDVTRLQRNGYGLVTGVDDTTSQSVSLSTWLAAETEELAGLAAGEIPLTFGMLWNPAGGAVPNGLDEPPADKLIDFRLTVTNLVAGRPLLFPARTNGYYFRVSELAGYVPPHVIEWMVRHARTSERAYAEGGEELVPLPPIGDLPIVVATRMSVAFPPLLSAVPLWFVAEGAGAVAAPRRMLFTAGVLSSDFPVALFDAPLPRWPTLAIVLGRFPAGAGAGTPDVVMASDDRPHALFPANAVGDVRSFGAAILNTLRDWNDSAAARLPAFRDRIVVVRVHRNEGGLRLRLDAKTIEALADRGRRAGEMLVERFAAPSGLERLTDDDAPGWEHHRWLRYRTLMSSLRDLLARYEYAWYNPAQDDQPYDELVRATAPGTVPRRAYSFPNDPATRERLVALSEALAQLGDELSAQTAFAGNEPQPPGRLETRPGLDA